MPRASNIHLSTKYKFTTNLLFMNFQTRCFAKVPERLFIWTDGRSGTLWAQGGRNGLSLG
ncbi:hypothetical protein AGABI2DRAFT_191628 [Agaricus bisporus var. bisporus H97]|uniref:hypothetical protein n=1 Tax=Agaricus bisporus var. bisporus (strain H97 / ATCC MYA-4626 / FGSC 10389) TaxID=936046 RepID=UPI00029F6BE3|nr:hypothetical protein AGABI2DRAFT_191628 [Agaricus bisporus var. bisporus H97]EKV47914.1 hypothetical protein AGABI2DRAFT_191628 [Agaricus bisporus var. bisporus H97]